MAVSSWPREVDVADDAGIRTAAGRLELVDDLHGPHLRRARHRARRQRRPQHVDRPEAGTQVGGHLRRQMHHVAVALEREQLVDLLGAEHADAAHVVARQVDEHDVLGALLRILLQLGRHAPLVGLGAPAAARAGDRTADDAAVEQLHHRLGRTADDGHLGVADEVHVRARVDLAQAAVHVERLGVELQVEALRQHDLEDVAGEDVLAGHGDHVGEALLGDGARDLGQRFGVVRADRRPARRARGRRRPASARPGRRRRRTARRDPSDASGGTNALASSTTRWRQWSNAAIEPMIDMTASGSPRSSRRRVGQVLDFAHDLVAEVTDDATVQRRQVLELRRVVGVDDGLDRGEDAAVQRHAVGDARPRP